MNNIRTFIFVLLALSLSSAYAVDEWRPAIEFYGKPDEVKSSEYEKPRPPIVLRQAIYKKQGVRILFYPKAPAGSPPPYEEWKLWVFLDNKTKLGLNESTEATLKRFGKTRKDLERSRNR